MQTLVVFPCTYVSSHAIDVHGLSGISTQAEKTLVESCPGVILQLDLPIICLLFLSHKLLFCGYMTCIVSSSPTQISWLPPCPPLWIDT